MPTKRTQDPDPDVIPDTPPTTDPEPTAPDKPVESAAADEVPPGRLPAGVYEFTFTVSTQYLEVPLTARPATDDAPATVFAWLGSAPDDGRWQPTRKKPNQLPDNAPADPEGE